MTRALSVLFYSLAMYALPALAIPSQQPFIAPTSAVTKVPVQLGVMSQCPDAILACEPVFVDVLKEVRDIVDFSLTYIAKSVARIEYR